jgi:hypothetical protein
MAAAVGWILAEPQMAKQLLNFGAEKGKAESIGAGAIAAGTQKASPVPAGIPRVRQGHSDKAGAGHGAWASLAGRHHRPYPRRAE